MRRSDEALLRATPHDAQAFAAFYDRHLPAVLAYFRRRVAEPEVAVDLAAETFARVLEHAAAYDPGRGSPLGWLFAIARNLLTDALRERAVADAARRRLGMATVTLADDDMARAEELADGAERRAERALEGLGRAQRDAVWARIVLERDYDEIARDLACSQSVVRQRVSRGVRALRAQLVEEER